MSPAANGEDRSLVKPSSYSGYCIYEEADDALTAAQESMDDPKAFWRQSRLLAAADSVQPNWGRVHAAAQKQYSLAFQRPTARTHPVPMVGRAASPFIVTHLGRVIRRKPPAIGEPVIEALRDELEGMIAAIGDAPLRQLAQELQQAVDFRDKVALVKSWMEQLEESVPTRHDGPSQAVTKAVVLERLEGYVDQVDGPTAYVTLKSQHGDELFGEYSADDLACKGITEGRRFRCETVEVDGAVHVTFEAVPDEPVTAQEEDAIGDRIGELLRDDDLDGDY